VPELVVGWRSIEKLRRVMPRRDNHSSATHPDDHDASPDRRGSDGALLITSRAFLRNYLPISEREGDLPWTLMRERLFRGEVQCLGAEKRHLGVRKNKEGRAFDDIH
jgi:hypothetical protein